MVKQLDDGRQVYIDGGLKVHEVGRVGRIPALGIKRVSSKPQTKGHGLKRQDLISVYADINGYEVMGWIEYDESASTFVRPKFEKEWRDKIVPMTQQGVISALLVDEGDRWTRLAYDGIGYINQGLRLGLDIVFCDLDLHSMRKDHMGAMLTVSQESTAFIDKLKRKTKPARDARADEGKIPNGQHVMFHDYDKDIGVPTLSEHNKEHWCEAGMILQRGRLDDPKAHFLKSATEYLLENGFAGPRSGKLLSNTSLARALRSPAAIGKYYRHMVVMKQPKFYEKSVRVEHEPDLFIDDPTIALFTEEEQKRIDAAISGNLDDSARNTHHNYTPLGRRMWCKVHGGKLRGKPGHRGRQLYKRCVSAPATTPCGSCGRRYGASLWRCSLTPMRCARAS